MLGAGDGKVNETFNAIKLRRHVKMVA